MADGTAVQRNPTCTYVYIACTHVVDTHAYSLVQSAAHPVTGCARALRAATHSFEPGTVPSVHLASAELTSISTSLHMLLSGGAGSGGSGGGPGVNGGGDGSGGGLVVSNGATASRAWAAAGDGASKLPL